MWTDSRLVEENMERVNEPARNGGEKREQWIWRGNIFSAEFFAVNTCC